LLKETSGPEQTEALGESLAKLLLPGDIITLAAPLGGGKTTLVRGLARGLGIEEDAVTSPTFVLWHIYAGRLKLHHLDAYRLRSPEELSEIGLEELLEGTDVVVLEWPGVALSLLPSNRLEIFLDYVEGEPDRRRIELTGRGAWEERLRGWNFEA